jgi:hypothetical protein
MSVDDPPAFNLDAQWTVESSPVTSNLNGVWASNKDLAYAVGDNHVILKYNGGQWNSVSNSETANYERGLGA